MKIPFSKTLNKMIRDRAIKQLIKGWLFSEVRTGIFINEFEDWQKNYLPISVKGKIVLDVGAGEGESALFYLMHGAKKVLCVESNEDCLENLLYNSDYHNIIPVLEPFDLTMLRDYKFDFMKMDIEGYEEVLLTTELNKSSVIEVHGLQLRDKFINKGFRTTKRFSRTFLPFSTTYAYWMC